MDDPDGWDHGISIFLCLGFIFFVVADVVGYLKKTAKVENK